MMNHTNAIAMKTKVKYPPHKVFVFAEQKHTLKAN